jgi:iron complex outermembrane recepter protein
MSKHADILIPSLIAGAVLAFVSGSHAQAQNAVGSTAAATEDSSVLEEVIVTAEKRAVNVQTLPASVTPVNGGEMLQQGVKDITDLSRVAPEVNVTTGLLNNIGIRGIRTSSFGPTLDSANAVYIDGNYNARFTSLNGLFFDMARVEVLDGPQGTLYGRNSAGGAINIITNKPTQEFGGYGSVEFGNYRDLTVNAALNLPLTDSLAFRVAYFRDYHEGYERDSGEDDQNLQGGRAELLWKPTDNDSLLISAQESELGGKGQGATTITTVFKSPTILTDTTSGQILPYNAACPAGNACTSQVVPINASNDPRRNAVLVGEANLVDSDTSNTAFALQYDHTFENFATATLQASRMNTISNNSSGDTAGLAQNPLLVASGLFLTDSGATPYSSPDRVNDRWDSQELRLTSLSTTPLQWVAGLYRYHELGSGANPTFVTTPTTAVGSAGGLVFPAGSPVVYQDIPNLLNNDNARAIFGQATWTPWFTQSLHLTGGLRYNDEGKHGVVTIYPTNGPIAKGAFGPTGIFDQSHTWTATTYKANISYDLTPSNLVYFDRSTGFQSGGYGYGGSPAYQPTYIKAFEVGSKNRFLDNTLQVNASAWYYSYINQTANVSDVFLVQFSPFAPAAPFNFITVANAGSSIDRGQSLDVQWNATRDDRIGANLQHINAVYTNFNLTQRYLNTAATFGVPFSALYPGYSATGNQSGPSFNYNGTQVGGAPKFTVLSNYDHTFRFGERTVTTQVVYRYVGQTRNGNQEQPNMPPGDAYAELPGYSTFDLNIAYAPADGKYSVTFFSRNLADKVYETARGYVNNGAALSPANSLYAYETGTFGPPRTFGVRIQANF